MARQEMVRSISRNIWKYGQAGNGEEYFWNSLGNMARQKMVRSISRILW